MVSKAQQYRLHEGPEPRPKKTTEFATQTDDAIWRAFKNGDEAAFIHIYHAYVNVLYNYGAKFSTDKELVEDCLQDFFLYLRKSRENLSDTNNIKLYLLKSFRRRVIEYVNKHQNELKRNKGIGEFLLEIEDSPELKYIDQQAREAQAKKLNDSLSKLDKKEREAVFFFYYEGLSYKEIAELMDFSHVASARRLIYRALGNLRDLFLTLTFLIYLL